MTPLTRPPVVVVGIEQEWAARMLESVLGPSGFAVVRAYSGQQVLDLAEAASPDAILIGSRLSDIDGVEVCRTLRESGGLGAEVPIILIVSGPAPREAMLEAYRAGAWAVWEQPMDGELLLLRLQTWVNAKRVTDVAAAENLLDGDTGLYSLRGLTRRAQELSAAARRRSTPLSCVAVGPHWNAGAASSERDVMARIGQTLRTVTRTSDTVGRSGSTEFMVLAPDTGEAGAVELVERVRDALSTSGSSARGSTIGGRLQVHVGVSTALPAAMTTGTVGPDLLRQAAVALRFALAAPQPTLRRFDEVPPGFA